MANNIGARVELAGEREFRQALSQINAGLKVTASELALVTAKYADNDKSVAALTARNEALQKQYESQQKRIETLREALAKAQEVYGETDKKTLMWQESLNKAETELVKTEKELQDNSKELKKAQENMTKYGLSVDEVAKSQSAFGGKLADIIDGLGIRLPAGADQAIRSLDATKISTMALVGVVTGLLTGLGKATIEVAKYADEIITMSQVTGLATDTIQEMKYAAELIDVSAETMTSSMSKMIRSMDDARKGTGDTAEAFRKLRLRVTDNNGQLKDSEQMFYDVVDALGQVRNETERDAIAMEIFGRSARELNPLIKAGSKSLKDFGQEAREMGYIMSEESLQKFGALDDAMQRLNNQTKALKNNMAIVLLPIMTSFFEILNKIDPKIILTVGAIGSMIAISYTIVKAIKNVTDIFKDFDMKTLKTTAIVVGVTAALIALATIIAVIIGKSKELNQSINNVGQNIAGMTNLVSNAPNQVRYSYASGIDYVPSDRVALIHRGEAVIPANQNPYNPSATNPMGGTTIVNLNVKMDEVDEVYKLVQVVRNARQTMRAGMVIV